MRDTRRFGQTRGEPVYPLMDGVLVEHLDTQGAFDQCEVRHRQQKAAGSSNSEVEGPPLDQTIRLWGGAAVRGTTCPRRQRAKESTETAST